MREFARERLSDSSKKSLLDQMKNVNLKTFP